MAGDPHYLPLVLGMGLTTLSMHPTSLLEARQQVRRLQWHELRRQTETLLREPDPDTLERRVTRLAN
jgi:phosphotransferase system enzyme I (PtsI)